MSGSDYTQTPHLRLYKPNYDADAEQWGNHLNMNADTLDAFLQDIAPGGSYLSIGGGTMVGPLTLADDPNQPLQAATKQYVDAAPFLMLDGSRAMTGTLVLPQGAINNTSIRFGASQSNSGLYAIGSTTVISSLGYQMLTVSPSNVTTGGPLLVPTGSTTTPSLVLGAADGTGLSRSGNALVLGIQGQPALAIFATGSQFYWPVSLLGNKVISIGDATDPADALNMRTGDARYAPIAGSPFLPLAGGVVTGATTLSAGGTFSGTFSGAHTYSGAVTFSSAGTALSVTNNATVGGTLAVTGTTTVGGTFNVTTGNGIFGSGAGSALTLSFVSAAGQSRYQQWFSGGTGASNLRWRVGGNGTDDWVIVSYDDTGATIGNALVLTRLTMGAAFAGTVRTPFLNMGGATGIGLSTVISATTGGIPFSQSPLFVNYTFTGTNSSPVTQNYNSIIVNDNVAYTGAGISSALLVQNNAQANSVGSNGLYVLMQQTQAPIRRSGFQTAVTFSSNLSYNCGGTGFATLALAQGSNNCMNTYTTLSSGATFIAGIKGWELDINCQAGSSVGAKTAILITRLTTDVVQGAWNVDTGISFATSGGAAATTGWDYILGFGSPNAQIPYKPTATLIKAFQPQTPSTGQALAECGIDFYGVTFSGNAFQSAGWSVDGSGNTRTQSVEVGGFSMSPSGSTLTVAQAGRASSLTGISAPGGGYTAGDKVSVAGGGLFVITAVSGSVPTAVMQLVPAVSASPPPNPVDTVYTNLEPGSGTLWHSPGSGLTLNLTWSAAGGVIALEGDIITGKQSAGATTDTTGHLLIPFVAGTPTGVPANAARGIAIRYDIINHKLWAFDPITGGWLGIVFA